MNEDKSFRHLSPLSFLQDHGYGNQVLPMIIVLDFILQGVYVFNLKYIKISFIMQKQQITNRIRNTNKKFILEVIKCMNYGLDEKEKDYTIQQTNSFFSEGRKQPNYLQNFIQILYYLQG